MKKIYIAFLISALTFPTLAMAQSVQWMTSTSNNYVLNPELPLQPACASANRIYAARMVDFALDFSLDIFGSMAIDCYDLSGSLMWSFPFGDSIMVESITSDASGNVVVGGAYMETLHLGTADSLTNTSFGLNVNLFLFSLDASGNLLWKRNISLTYPFAWELSPVGMDNLGNCWYGLAFFDSTSITRLDPNGNDMQSHMIFGTRSMNSFSFDPMGNLYVTGSSGSIVMSIGSTSVNVPEQYMMFVTRIDAAGNCSWIKLAHDITFQSPQIVTTDNGDAYVAGNLFDTTAFGTIFFDGPEWVYDFFLTKVDSTGNFSWGVEVPEQQTLTGDFQRGKNNFIDVDASGNVYMTGTIRGLVDWGNGVISDAGTIPSNGIAIISFDGAGIARWQITGVAAGFIAPTSMVTTGLDECYFATSVVGELTVDSITTNPGTDFAFALGKISSATGIYSPDAADDFLLYPNPVRETLFVNRYLLSGTAEEISIFNALGENVISVFSASDVTDNFQIDVSKLPPGIYFLSIGDVKKKFVVQH